jgi:ElaB/YqjD/DUF883 family membrane-anchored ribosome-binding protein
MDKEPNLTEQDPEQLRQQIDETRSSLTEKLETLETEVKDTVKSATSAVVDTVETVKHTVEQTVETVKGTVEGTVETVKDTFDLHRQTERHPWAMVGGSILAGFLTGRLLPGAERIGRALHFHEGPRGDGSPMGFRTPEASYSSGAAPAYQGTAEAASPGVLSELADKFAPEIDKLKGLAIGAAMGLVRDLIKQSVPATMVEQAEGLVDSFTTKLGGQPISGPVWPSSSEGSRAV